MQVRGIRLNLRTEMRNEEREGGKVGKRQTANRTRDLPGTYQSELDVGRSSRAQRVCVIYSERFKKRNLQGPNRRS